MNVRELREMLQSLEAEGKGEMDVKFGYNSRDYWSTFVAESIHTVEEAAVQFSKYHEKDEVLDSDKVDRLDEEGEKIRTAIVLS